MRSQAAISVLGIELGYSEDEPLYPAFTIDAQQAELVALVGRNGVGKSTLLRTICGLHNALSGSISIMGVELALLTRQQRSKLLSFVPAEPVKVANLFIRDFVALARYPYTGWSSSLSETDWLKVDNALHAVGIEYLANRDITQVSDGERQRAMIAFALAQDTKIILLDEPTAFLDLPNKFEMVRLLSQLAHQHSKTIVYSTHDLQGAMSEADIIWLMLDTGFVSGAPEDIALGNKFNQFLANTQMVFDTKSGLFKNQRNLNKSIALEGQGEALLWTQRLAERLGFSSVISSSEAELRVCCIGSDNGYSWEIFQNGEQLTIVNSLTELSRVLRGIL